MNHLQSAVDLIVTPVKELAKKATMSSAPDDDDAVPLTTNVNQEIEARETNIKEPYTRRSQRNTYKSNSYLEIDSADKTELKTVEADVREEIPFDSGEKETVPDTLEESIYSEILCSDDCKYNRKHDKHKMVRCCFCMTWLHEDCVTDTKEEIYASVIWYCENCRKLPTLITNEILHHHRVNNQLTFILEDKTAEIRMLREKITNLETELIKTHATLGGGDPRDKETIKTLLSQMDTLTKTNESLVKELATTASEKRKCLNTQDVKEKMPSTELNQGQQNQTCL